MTTGPKQANFESYENAELPTGDVRIFSLQQGHPVVNQDLMDDERVGDTITQEKSRRNSVGGFNPSQRSQAHEGREAGLAGSVTAIDDNIVVI